jgi:trimethylamine-N-oxide reductase (cytochrome c)
MEQLKKLVRKQTCTTGGPVFVDVDEEQNKIVRVYPIDLTDEDAPSWSVEAHGRTFTPPRRGTISPYTAGQKSMIHSKKRVLYPLKRIGFDVNGERNEEQRGTWEGGDPNYPGYERISWDEALDIVTGEMERCKRNYGPGSLVMSCSSHHLWGCLNYRHGTLMRFCAAASMVYADHNPDSWEGWHWGATHMWGFTSRLGLVEQSDGFKDCIQNAEMIVFWSSDPETTGGIYSSFESTVRRLWLKELGLAFVHIDPYYNNTAQLLGGKWLAPQLGTDAALAAAIAYVWLTEGTYDKEFVARATFGFEEWAKYILGESDGVPKTPEWAAEECKLQAHDIRALAREWASHKTMLACGGKGGWGGACRSPIGMDYARMMISLATMQGIGKPGCGIYSTTEGAPVDHDFYFPGYSDGSMCGDPQNTAASGELMYRMFDGRHSKALFSDISTGSGCHIDRLRIPECVHEDRVEWTGRGFIGDSIEQQFHHYHYPMDGYSRIKFLYKYGGPMIGTMSETNRYAAMYATKKLDFVVFNAVWFEGEAPFGDVILPVATNYERPDISEWTNNSGYNPDAHTQCNHRTIVYQDVCIKPLGESKPDFEIFSLICRRLGYEEIYNEGKGYQEWLEQLYAASDINEYSGMSFEDFKKKGYYIVPVDRKGPEAPPMRWFYEDREADTHGTLSRIHPKQQIHKKGLQTQSGKIEFVSNSLKRFGHYDTDETERPLMPMYIPSWEGHHTERIKDYPLAVVSPHPRFSFHTMGDGKDSFMNDIKDHRVLMDGHYYWIFRMNPVDATARGIREGDLIKAYNERGEVVFYCQVTERVAPGTCHCYESSSEYNPLGKPGHSTDRGGCINILTSKRFISKYATGMATDHCLVQVEKWNGR